MDLRGHGRSQGAPVWVDAFDDYLDDLDAFVSRVSAREPGKPVFLFGHSMGGAIVTLYTLTRKPALRGLLLSAPALKAGSDISPFLIAVTRFLGRALPRLPVLKLQDRFFSRDPEVVRANQQDPLIHKKPGPARTAAGLLGALERIGAQMEALTVPFFVMHGTEDRLTNPEGSKELYARARSTDKTLRLFDGLYHDLLYEPERAQVLAGVTLWIEERAR
jgi:alpha-beta hydrolase superfamily lysophospholipase